MQGRKTITAPGVSYLAHCRRSKPPKISLSDSTHDLLPPVIFLVSPPQPLQVSQSHDHSRSPPTSSSSPLPILQDRSNLARTRPVLSRRQLLQEGHRSDRSSLASSPSHLELLFPRLLTSLAPSIFPTNSTARRPAPPLDLSSPPAPSLTRLAPASHPPLPSSTFATPPSPASPPSSLFSTATSSSFSLIILKLASPTSTSLATPSADSSSTDYRCPDVVPRCCLPQI